jgi:superfamily II DNA/RNA helicase
MLKKKATSLLRVTYLVLDEADRMLSLGFEQQIRSIVGQTRDDRQTLLFTATMKKEMQFLVGDIINSPVRINVGEEGAANEDVMQDVVVVEAREAKFEWLIRHFNDLLVEGKVLVFANQRETC